MKNGVLCTLLLLMMVGCGHNITSKEPAKIPYYATPELIGRVLKNGQPLAGAQVLLSTSCDDRLAITNFSGYFNLGSSCKDFIDSVPKTELGYFYQVVINDGREQFFWQIGGLGYGFDKAELLIDLATQTVSYRIIDSSTIFSIHEYSMAPSD